MSELDRRTKKFWHIEPMAVIQLIAWIVLGIWITSGVFTKNSIAQTDLSELKCELKGIDQKNNLEHIEFKQFEATQIQLCKDIKEDLHYLRVKADKK